MPFDALKPPFLTERATCSASQSAAFTRSSFVLGSRQLKRRTVLLLLPILPLLAESHWIWLIFIHFHSFSFIFIHFHSRLGLGEGRELVLQRFFHQLRDLHRSLDHIPSEVQHERSIALRLRELNRVLLLRSFNRF